MLTRPMAQLALSFGAYDLECTQYLNKKITHDAGAKPSCRLSKNVLIDAIREAGRIPFERDYSV
jgi:2-iminoacetate synthase ThiH